jgi:hypothetical protein
VLSALLRTHISQSICDFTHHDRFGDVAVRLPTSTIREVITSTPSLSTLAGILASSSLPPAVAAALDDDSVELTFLAPSNAAFARFGGAAPSLDTILYHMLPGRLYHARHCQSSLALPCLALPCLALPCLALPCLALPCLAFAINHSLIFIVSFFSLPGNLRSSSFAALTFPPTLLVAAGGDAQRMQVSSFRF